MKFKQTALGVALVLLAGSAAATSLDYRAEYKHEDEKYAHRIKIGDSTKAFDGKLAFGVEQKFNSEDQQDFWNKVVRGDSEFSWAWTKSVGETGKWYIQPGMPITFANDKTTYKPQFRVGYKADFGLTTALRYRHELQVFAESASQKTLVDGGKLDVAGNTVQQGKWTLTGSYKFSQESLKNLKLSYEANLNHNYDDVRLANNKNWEWDLGIKIGYAIDAFQPYVEFWTVDQGSSAEDNRQLRTRAGIKYSF